MLSMLSIDQFKGTSTPYSSPRFVLRDGRYILSPEDKVELYSENGNQIFSIKFVDGSMTRLVDESLDGRYIIVLFTTVDHWVAYSLYYTIDLEKGQAVKYDIRLPDPIKFDGLGNIVTFGGSITKPGLRIVYRDNPTPKFIPTPHRPNDGIACDGSLIAFSYGKDSRTHFVLIDTMTDELTPLFDLPKVGQTFKITFVTPSVIFVRQYGSAGYFVYDITFKKLRVGACNNLSHEPKYTFSPDGRFLLYNWIGSIVVESIMDGEQTEFKVDPVNRPYADIRMSPRGKYVIYGDSKYTFDTPLPYPIYTIRYSVGWIRLMSNLTFETNTSWPSLMHLPSSRLLDDVRMELLRRGLSKDAMTLPLCIWASSGEPTETFEEVLGKYIVRLIRAIAKEMMSK